MSFRQNWKRIEE